MKLYEAPSPNAACAFFMAEKGLECDRVAVDIRAAENLQPIIWQKPWRSVPMLQLDDGTCIGESVAICRYMESIQSEPALFGATGVEAAKVEMWQRRAELGFCSKSLERFATSGFFKDRKPVLPNGVKYVPSGHRRCLRCLMSNWRKRLT